MAIWQEVDNTSVVAAQVQHISCDRVALQSRTGGGSQQSTSSERIFARQSPVRDDVVCRERAWCVPFISLFQHALQVTDASKALHRSTAARRGSSRCPALGSID